MNGPGYSSAGASESDGTVQAALNDGYNVLTWDPRGFGQSGGQVEVDSPMYEARDASALIDMLAQQPEVQLDKPGDPHLGMIGASYGGGIQLVTAATDPRVDVITPQIAWNSLITSLDKSNTAKGGWGSILVGGGTAGSTTGVTNDPAGFGPTGRQDPHTTAAFTDGVASGEFTGADQSYFAQRGPDSLLSHIHIPTLLMQGTDDTLFTLHEAIANYKALQANGIPLQMLWFCGVADQRPDRARRMQHAGRAGPAYRRRLRAALPGSLPEGQRADRSARRSPGSPTRARCTAPRTTRPPRGLRLPPRARARW